MDEALEKRRQELNDLYVAAFANGLCKSKKEFASLIGRDYPTIVSALNGQERSCTESLLKYVRGTIKELSEKQELEEKAREAQDKEETPDPEKPKEEITVTIEDLLIELRLQTELLKSIKNAIEDIQG